MSPDEIPVVAGSSDNDPQQREREKKVREQLRDKVAEWLPALFPNASSPIDGIIPGMGALGGEPSVIMQAVGDLTDYQQEGLRQRLRLAADLVKNSSSHTEAVLRAGEEHARRQKHLDDNLAAAYRQIRPVETRYRALSQFFENAGEPGQKVSAFIFNADPKALFEEASESLAKLTEKIKNTNAEAFNQLNAKAMLVIPGHWAEGPNLAKIESTLADNRIMLFTDIFTGMKNMEDFNNMKARLELPKYRGLVQPLWERAHVVVCVNEICGRAKYAWEDDHVWVPSSTAVAGKQYRVDEGAEIAMVRDGAAGFPDGKLKTTVPMVRTAMNLTQVGTCTDVYRIVPIIENMGNLYIYGVGTLCSDERWKQYPVVRIHDFITKVLLDYCHTLLFKRFDERNVAKVKSGVQRFLNDMKNRGVIKTYGDFSVVRDGKEGELGKIKINVPVTYYDIIQQVRVNLVYDEASKKVSEGKE